MAIAYFQPITRGELSQFLGREVSRDAIAALREEDLIAAGPRSPTPGAPYAYVLVPVGREHPRADPKRFPGIGCGSAPTSSQNIGKKTARQMVGG